MSLFVLKDGFSICFWMMSPLIQVFFWKLEVSATVLQQLVLQLTAANSNYSMQTDRNIFVARMLTKQNAEVANTTDGFSSCCLANSETAGVSRRLNPRYSTRYHWSSLFLLFAPQFCVTWLGWTQRSFLGWLLHPLEISYCSPTVLACTCTSWFLFAIW